MPCNLVFTTVIWDIWSILPNTVVWSKYFGDTFIMAANLSSLENTFIIFVCSLAQHYSDNPPRQSCNPHGEGTGSYLVKVVFRAVESSTPPAVHFYVWRLGSVGCWLQIVMTMHPLHFALQTPTAQCESVGWLGGQAVCSIFGNKKV